MFRNIADHGIETVERRQYLGKNPEGLVKVDTQYLPNRKDRFLMTISDDGGGVNFRRIREKLKEKNRAAEAERATDQELLEYLFEPGFSTAQEVTDLSGRGVGLDAVRASVKALNGRMWMESTPNEGTTFFFELPVLREFSFSETAPIKLAA